MKGGNGIILNIESVNLLLKCLFVDICKTNVSGQMTRILLHKFDLVSAKVAWRCQVCAKLSYLNGLVNSYIKFKLLIGCEKY